MAKANMTECSICLEEIHAAGQTRMLPCGHGCHTTCLSKWLARKNTCPMCRRIVPKEPQDDPRIAFMFQLTMQTIKQDI